MRIAIHHKEEGYSKQWITYCKKNNIEYKIVNAYDSNIIDQLRDCDAFMWHHTHGDYRDVLFAKQLIFSLETAGIKCFPNFYTTWHFDDKVGQKYLLEAIGAPLVPSYVFYTKKEALSWVNKTSFPKVFKLRGGAASTNVMLAKTPFEAKRLVRKAFGRGFPQFNRIGFFFERWTKWKDGKESFNSVIKGIVRLFVGSEFGKMRPREKGYVYFQDFIPNNKFDIRVVVVNGKIWAEKRMVRKGDFRASGSGKFVYEKIDETILKIAFDTAEKLKLQSVAFDFILDGNKPLIVEMSYGFGTKGIGHSPGYYDKKFEFHQTEDMDFLGDMVQCVIE